MYRVVARIEQSDGKISLGVDVDKTGEGTEAELSIAQALEQAIYDVLALIAERAGTKLHETAPALH